MIGTYVSIINSETPLYVVDYHSKFSVVKKVNTLTADGLVQTTKLIFVEHGFPKKTVSDLGTNFTSEMLNIFAGRLTSSKQ